MKTRTIKAKITIWFSVLLIILVCIVLALLFFIGQSVLKTNTRDSLKLLVEMNTEELEYLNEGDQTEDDEGDHYVAYKDGYLEIDDDFCDYRDGMYISLYYREELLYGENPIEAHPDILPMQDGKLQELSYHGKKYYVYDLNVRSENMEELWLRGVVDKQEGTPLLLKITHFLLLALPLLAFATVLGGYLIARRTLQPLQDICEQADSMNEGSDLSRRIEINNESVETRRIVDTFNRMFDRLYHSFQSERQFTSDASHELRTPVAVIQAECEYALEEDNPAEWKEALEVILRQNEKMSGMIEELLMFTRMECGTFKLQMKQIDFSALTEEVCREQERIQKKDICLQLDLEPAVMLVGDEGLLSRMVINLISNAYKYSREPGNIWVSLYRNEEKKTVLSVRDDGIGIREGELPLIWNRFYRADNARNDSTSTGLGLSMVRQIAIIHHAQIKVFSEIDKGSTFLIFF